MTDLLHRIRWANVARAAALLLAALLALAWPRLKTHDDGLPPALAEPVPAAGEDAATTDHDAPPGVAAPSDTLLPAPDAAQRKAASRRTAKAATAKRAKKRRRTVARRRRAAGATPVHARARPEAARGVTGNAPSFRRPAAPASPAAEFRP
jgi:hypothetical protein